MCTKQLFFSIFTCAQNPGHSEDGSVNAVSSESTLPHIRTLHISPWDSWFMTVITISSENFHPRVNFLLAVFCVSSGL